MYRDHHIHPNQTLEQKFLEENKKRHQEQIKNASSSFQPLFSEYDPKRYQSVAKIVRNSSKKDYLFEERATEIERQNRILVEKMNNVYRGRTPGGIQSLLKLPSCKGSTQEAKDKMQNTCHHPGPKIRTNASPFAHHGGT